MRNKFRLTSSAFERSEENHQKDFLKVVFLSVEGNKTEQQYFEYIDKYRSQLGINSIVHVYPLKRSEQDTSSDPVHVLELLEEYMEYRNAEILPESMRSVIPAIYSDDFIKSYLANEEIDLNKKNEFKALLNEANIDLAYMQFLKDYSGPHDVFGIVIDRDSGNHPIDVLEKVFKECRDKKYQFYITNPCIEFWLLLHLVNIRETYSKEMDQFLGNKHISNRHTFTSKLVSELAGHSKKLSEKIFVEKYLPNIDFAIKQTIENFETHVERLIQSSESDSGELGSNLPDLFKLLKTMS